MQPRCIGMVMSKIKPVFFLLMAMAPCACATFNCLFGCAVPPCQNPGRRVTRLNFRPRFGCRHRLAMKINRNCPATPLLFVDKHARMTHEEANWRLSLTQHSVYSNSFSSGNEGKATCIERIGMDRPCGLARRRLPTCPPPRGESQLDEESGSPLNAD